MRHLAGLAVTLLVGAALCWEVSHLSWWADMLSHDAVNGLREHAYSYVSKALGPNPFGWRLG